MPPNTDGVPDTDQGAGAGGRAALTRLDRDVLSVPGLRTVVVTQGLEDIVTGHDDVDIDNALGLLRDQLTGWGIKVVLATLTPCDGYGPCTTSIDQNRVYTNTWITDQLDFTTPTVNNVDAESVLAVTDAASTTDPQALKLGNDAAPADYDAGDHVNLTPDAYTALSNAYDLPSRVSRSGVRQDRDPSFHSAQLRFQPLRPLSGATVLSPVFFTTTTSPMIQLVENQ